MAKLRGPSLSTAASGTIGKVLTFSRWKKSAYIKHKPTPKQPRTGLQVSMRAMMKFLSQQWKNLTASEQATWAGTYPDPQLNNYNAFIRHNLERWRRKAPPSKEYPATEENNPGAVPYFAATGYVRHVKTEYDEEIEIRDNWTFLIFHSTVASPDPDLDKLIHVALVEDLDVHYWTHSPLPAGTHYYKAVPTANDGNVDWTTFDADDAVVT